MQLPGCDASFVQGETFTEAFDLGVNLTGKKLRSVIPFPAPLELTIDNGGWTVPDPESGFAVMNIAKAITGAVRPGYYPWDVFMTTPDGTATQLRQGLLKAVQSITPPTS